MLSARSRAAISALMASSLVLQAVHPASITLLAAFLAATALPVSSALLVTTLLQVLAHSVLLNARHASIMSVALAKQAIL